MSYLQSLMCQNMLFNTSVSAMVKDWNDNSTLQKTHIHYLFLSYGQWSVSYVTTLLKILAETTQNSTKNAFKTLQSPLCLTSLEKKGIKIYLQYS